MSFLNSFNYVFNPHAVPFFISGILNLLLGIFVFSHGRKSSIHRAFFLVSLMISAWLLPQGMTFLSASRMVASFWEKLSFIGVSWVSVSIYGFSVEWLGPTFATRLIRRIGYLVGAVFIAIIFTTAWIVQLPQKFKWGYYSVFSEPGGTIYLSFFAFYMFAFFYQLLSALRREKGEVRRKHIKLMIVGFFIAFLGSFDFLPCYGIQTYPIGYATIFSFALMMAYCIIRYQLMDIQTVIHKTVVWLASSIVAVAPFAFLFFSIQEWMRSLTPAVSTVFSIGLLLFFYFYFRAIQPRLDHLFRRRRANLQNVFSQFSAELVHLKNLRDLLQGVVRLLRRTLYVGKVSIYLKDASGAQLDPTIVKRVRGLEPFALDHPFLKWLEKRDAVVLADLVQTDPEVEPFREALLDYFSRVQAAVAVPLVLGENLIGIIHLGKKDNLRRYFSDEIQFLERLKAAVTIAFSNSMQAVAMQESLRQWNVELEKKVDERTKELKDTQAQLIQAEKLATIGTLAGGIAHEINNPLTAVLTNAQILKMDANQEDIDSISLIEEGAKRCQVIIQKLMKYARKSAEPEIREKVDVNKVVDNMAAFLEYQLRQDNIQLVTDEKRPLSVIHGNANELEQVVTNLVLNAKDAIKLAAREGRIVVKTFEENGSVGLSVSDNGIGIPKENLAKIFDPFFTTKDVGKGTGLGLAVTYGIVQKHNGKIEVSSIPGQGSTFTVFLPNESL